MNIFTQIAISRPASSIKYRYPCATTNAHLLQLESSHEKKVFLFAFGNILPGIRWI